MRMHSALLLSALFSLTLAPGAVFGAGPNLGKTISPADLAPWDIDTERGSMAHTASVRGWGSLPVRPRPEET